MLSNESEPLAACRFASGVVLMSTGGPKMTE